MTRREKLGQALAARHYDALVVTQRPNQLYFVPHAEPVSGLPPIPYMLLTEHETIVIPGPMFYYACRDQLTECEVIKTEVGDPNAQSQLASLVQKRDIKRLAFDHLAPATAAFLRNQIPDT